MKFVLQTESDIMSDEKRRQQERQAKADNETWEETLRRQGLERRQDELYRDMLSLIQTAWKYETPDGNFEANKIIDLAFLSVRRARSMAEKYLAEE